MTDRVIQFRPRKLERPPRDIMIELALRGVADQQRIDALVADLLAPGSRLMADVMGDHSVPHRVGQSCDPQPLRIVRVHPPELSASSSGGR